MMRDSQGSRPLARLSPIGGLVVNRRDVGECGRGDARPYHLLILEHDGDRTFRVTSILSLVLCAEHRPDGICELTRKSDALVHWSPCQSCSPQKNFEAAVLRSASWTSFQLEYFLELPGDSRVRREDANDLVDETDRAVAPAGARRVMAQGCAGRRVPRGRHAHREGELCCRVSRCRQPS